MAQERAEGPPPDGPSTTFAAAPATGWLRAHGPGIADAIEPLQRTALFAAVPLLAIGAIGLASADAGPGPAPAEPAPRVAADTVAADTPAMVTMTPLRMSAPSTPVLEPGARAPTPLLPTPQPVDEKQVWTTPAPTAEPAPPPPQQVQQRKRPKPDNSVAGAFRNFQRDLARLFR